MMTLGQGLFLCFAAAIAGALNSVVGGGSFVAFPALLFCGVRPVLANATTSVVLWPAAIASTLAYRGAIRQPRRVLVALGAVSAAGSAIGAALLLGTPNTLFVRLVPWLLLFATLLFSFGGPIAEKIRRRPLAAVGAEEPGAGREGLVLLALLQFAIAIYGGYFGGGMGIMMLAAFSLLGLADIHAMNGLRTLLGTLINGVAVAAFIAARAVAWAPGLVMVVAATAAGYAGAAVAQRLDPRWVRRFVTLVAWGMTAYFFLRPLGSPALR